MIKLYKKQVLLACLKDVGLPSSYFTLLRYEKIGIIPPAPYFAYQKDGTPERLYTNKSIGSITKKVRTYVEKRTNKPCIKKGCLRLHYALGFCKVHYSAKKRQYKKG